MLETYYHAHKDALAAAYAGGGIVAERLHRMIRDPLIQRNLAPLFTFIEEALGEITPEDGPLAAINFFTYAPVLASLWPGNPTSAVALDERRRHVHCMVDTILAALAASAEASGAARPSGRDGRAGRGPRQR